MFGCASGVIHTKVGYTGGTTTYPTYHNLSDHTESVQLIYDPRETNYESLLKLFWKGTDATNRRSRQYMSAIFYHNPEQEALARMSLNTRQMSLNRPIVTQILPAQTFYDAEEYHQKYYLKQHPWLLYSLDIDPDDITDSFVCTRLNGYVAGFGCLKQFEEEVCKLGLDDTQTTYVRKAFLKESKINKGCSS